MSIFYTWMYNGTRGSLLIAMLLHATTNLPLLVIYTPLYDQVLPALFCVMSVSGHSKRHRLATIRLLR